jgi:RNA polymerase sigma factor (sigma-70 family)
MRGGPSRNVLRELRTLYRCGVTGNQSDEELLERFVVRRDDAGEDAFAALVQRHGPMVLGVCRRVLGDAHEAEDAFQATFLILARKATSVIRREKVASWLHGVACRTAREARGRALRRRAREERVSKSPRIEPPDHDCVSELRAILDEELARLPLRYRGAIVLCELEGLSRQEAAQRLGIPEGTLSSRLARGKDRLRDRLRRRGLAVGLVPMLATLFGEGKAGMLPVALVESTVAAAMRVAAGCSAAGVVTASVASLTEGVLKAMLIGKLKAIVLCAGTLAVAVSGAAALAQSGTTLAERAAQGDADRISAMEKKLDRILDALDRLTANAESRSDSATSSSSPKKGAAVKEHRLVTVAPSADTLRGSNYNLAAPKETPDRVAQSLDAIPSLYRDPGPRSDRIGALEQTVGQLKERLAKVERRLAEVERRIGEAPGASSHLRPSDAQIK